MRPQDPTPPLPYSEEEVSYSAAGVLLAGTLSVPNGAGPFPAVLLIKGSGAYDRDQTVFGHRTFAVIADALARAGIAVLRVDDRGVGGSQGVLSEATYEDLCADILAGVARLGKDARIDRQRIGLLGHSEGGALAPLAVSGRNDVAFVVLLAAPAVDGMNLMLEQNRLILTANGASDEQLAEQCDFVRDIAEMLKRGANDAVRQRVRSRVVEQVGANGNVDRDELEALIQAHEDRTTSPYYRSLLCHDPPQALSRLRTPVLAVANGRSESGRDRASFICSWCCFVRFAPWTSWRA